MKKKRVRFCLIILIPVIVFDWMLLLRMEQYVSDKVTAAAGTAQLITREIQYFPIAVSTNAPLSFDFADSWMAERTYGGSRSHEGCDIITTEDVRGIYPVVSMTDGVIESIGWLQLGGYRIGIRSPGGIYYYYAHMESYAAGLAEGQDIRAGQFLGFVGDSGYGEEGTVGQFLVHLHIGIYVPDADGEDAAVNPYPYLEAVRETVIRAAYTNPEDSR
ncbi:MAG: M23 family metallopeptidase [Lachnospiraceae bacterium]|nr:M23 family metallopeptidase [Lachnospiraceae bacterium]